MAATVGEPLTVPEGHRKNEAQIRFEAKTILTRLLQRVDGRNPTQACYDIGVPILATALLESRSDVVAQAAQRITMLVRQNESARHELSGCYKMIESLRERLKVLEGTHEDLR